MADFLINLNIVPKLSGGNPFAELVQQANAALGSISQRLQSGQITAPQAGLELRQLQIGTERQVRGAGAVDPATGVPGISTGDVTQFRTKLTQVFKDQNKQYKELLDLIKRLDPEGRIPLITQAAARRKSRYGPTELEVAARGGAGDAAGPANLEEANRRANQALIEERVHEAVAARESYQSYRQLVVANQSYIVNTALLASATQALRAQVKAKLAIDGKYIQDKAAEVNSNQQLKTAVEHARSAVADFAKIETQLASAQKLNLAVILQEKAGDTEYITATHLARVARLELAVAEAKAANNTKEVGRLQGILAAATLVLANDTKKAAQGTAGYSNERRRAGELAARDRALAQEGARRVTDTPEARRDALTRKVSLSRQDLADPDLRALAEEEKSVRRNLLILEKRNLLTTAAGQAFLVKSAQLAEEIAEVQRRVRDGIRNTPAARQFRAQRNLDQATADSANPQLLTLQRELATILRARNYASKEALLATEAGRASLAEEARIDAEITAIRRRSRAAVNERHAVEDRTAARGGAAPGRFENLQAGLQGPGFAQALGRRFITTGQFALAGITFRSLVQGISSVVKEAEQLQRTFSLIKAQFSSIGQGSEFGAFREQILGIARDTGVSADQVATVGFQIKGVFGADTQKAITETRAAIRSALVTGLPQKEIVDSLTAASIAYGTSIDAITDKAIGVEERFGVLARESIKFFGDISDTAASTGLGLNQLGDIVGVLQKKLAISGGALSEQFSRVLGTLTDNSSKVIEIYSRYPALTKRLPNLSEAIGKGSGAVLLELATGFNELSDSAQSSIAYQIGGARQFRTLKAVLQGYNEEVRKGTTGIDDNGKALKREASLQETVAIQTDRLRERFRQFGDAIFEAGVGDALTGVLHAIGGIADGVGGLLRVFSSINKITHGWLSGVLLVGAAFAAIQATVKAIATIQAASRLAQVRLFGAAGAASLGGPAGGARLSTYFGASRLPIGRAPVLGPPAPIRAPGGGFSPGASAAGAGLGASAAGTLAAAAPALALIAAGIFASQLSKRADEEKRLMEELRGKLQSGDAKDQRAVEKLAKERRSVGDIFRATVLSPEGWGKAGKEVLEDLSFGLFHGDTADAPTPQEIAKRALAEQERVRQGKPLANYVRAFDQLQTTGIIPGPAPANEGFSSALLGSLYGGDFSGELETAIKDTYGKNTTIQDVITGLEAGEKGTLDKAGELLKALNANPKTKNPATHAEFLRILAEIERATNASDDVADIRITVENATRLYQMGRLTRTEYTRLVNDKLAAIRGRVEDLKRQKAEVPVDVLQALDETQKLSDDLLASVRDDGLKLFESLIGISKSKTQDPGKLAGLDVKSANEKLAVARGKYADAVAKLAGSADPTDHTQVDAAQAGVNDAIAGVNAATVAKQKSDDEEADAKKALERAKEGGSKNEIRNARRAKEDADLLAKRAKERLLGPAAEARALTAQIEADRTIEEAANNLTRARLGLLIAIANAAGNEVKAAELGVKDIQDQITRQKALDPTDETALVGLKTQLTSSKNTAAAARVSHTKELIDFQREMGEITVGQAIAQLTALLGSPDVQSNEARVRDIRRAIKSLKEQTSSDLAFNIGDLKIPTLYEVRRLGQTRQAGAGYNDNRQVAITITVNNQGDLDGALEAFSQAVNAPSRYGTSPRAFAYRN